MRQRTCIKCVCDSNGRVKYGQDNPEDAYDQMVKTIERNQKEGRTGKDGRPYDDTLFGIYCWVCSECDQLRWFTGHGYHHKGGAWSEVINWKKVKKIHQIHKTLAAAA